MKKIILIAIMFMVMIPMGLSVANYGDWNYGAGEYGENTPPNIDSFVPTDQTPQINFSTLTDFNVTFSDDDGDAPLIQWFVNNSFNTSITNLSEIFDIGVYNITANVSDNFDNSTVGWLVTVINDTTEVTPSVAGAARFRVTNSTNGLKFWINAIGEMFVDSLQGTYTGGSAYVCVYNNGTVYASEAACP